jgi:signal peptidase I
MRFLSAPLLIFWEFAKIVIISLAIIVPIRYFIVQPFFVRGASMEPTFKSGDYLIINEIGYRFSDPGRGDVIVFRPPQNTKQFYIKRIIGLPGEMVVIEKGKVWVGLDESSLTILQEDYLDATTPGETRVILSQEEYFVLGDNRDGSSDSRSWGALGRDNIIGKAWVRAWPFGSFKVIDGISYDT